MTGDWVDASLSEARRKLHKEVYDVVELKINEGWRLRKQAHAYGLYCPCPEDAHPRRCWHHVPGTPQNPSSAARRINRMCSTTNCPHRAP